MSDHASKTRARIEQSPAPRDIEWDHFITMWKNYADKVEQESGDRLAVDMNGHRVVFRRQHDGLVGIEDVERARKLFKERESHEGAPSADGSGSLFVVAITEKDARLYDFDLSAQDVETTQTEHEKNPDPRGHHMRTVEKKTGRDDKADLKRFFEDLAKELKAKTAGQGFVVLGHGSGTSDAAAGFVDYIKEHDSEFAEKVIASGTIDLSAAGEPELEKKARELAGR